MKGKGTLTSPILYREDFFNEIDANLFFFKLQVYSSRERIGLKDFPSNNVFICSMQKVLDLDLCNDTLVKFDIEQNRTSQQLIAFLNQLEI